MASHNLLILGLLGVGVGAQLLCCFGLMVIRDPLDRLHAVSAGLVGGALPIVTAMLIEEGWSASGLKILLTIGVLLVTGPAVIQATAQAMYPKNTRSVKRSL